MYSTYIRFIKTSSRTFTILKSPIVGNCSINEDINASKNFFRKSDIYLRNAADEASNNLKMAKVKVNTAERVVNLAAYKLQDEILIFERNSYKPNKMHTGEIQKAFDNHLHAIDVLSGINIETSRKRDLWKNASNDALKTCKCVNCIKRFREPGICP